MRYRQRSVGLRVEWVQWLICFVQLVLKLAKLRTEAEHAQRLSVRLTETDKLFSERTTGLSTAQAFLSKADAISEGEVVGMIENLNTPISSASGAV